MNGFKCGTAAGPAQSRPLVLWQVVSPEGEAIGETHSRYLDTAAELMEIQSVANEVHDRMRAAREMNWDRDDENMWVRENAPEVAKSLGYRINRITR